MITNSKQFFAYIDEVAMPSLSSQIENYFFSNDQQNHQEIGFAVSIDFTPNESEAWFAADSLMSIEQYLDHRHRHLLH